MSKFKRAFKKIKKDLTNKEEDKVIQRIEKRTKSNKSLAYALYYQVCID